MILFLILYLGVCLWKLKVCENNTYLSIESTQAIKGVFIIMVFFSHFNSYVNYVSIFDKCSLSLTSFFGQAMVAMFLFYSGYGVMESIQKKRNDYVSSIPEKRILRTLIRFDAAVMLYLLVCLIISEEVTISRLMFSLIGWDSLGNSNWYIFVVLLLYGICFVSFKVFHHSDLKALLSIFLVSAGLVIFVSYFKIKPVYWYDTAMCFSFGCIYSKYRKAFETMLHHPLVYGVVFVLSILVWNFTKGRYMFVPAIQYSAANIAFVMIVLLLTMKIQIKNNLLIWCGKNLFELYILQRIPMILLKFYGMNENIHLYFILCVVLTLVLVRPFKKLSESICNILHI